MWTSFFDKIYCINLPKRIDRLLLFVDEMDKYNIPFEIFNAIENENGAEGLRQTVELILKEALDNNYKQILIFEDDAYFVCDPNPIMELAIKELPEYWQILYLGGQASNGFNRRQSQSLLQLDTCFATHAWALSNNAIKTILAEGLKAPIDNFLVDTIQKEQKCFITYPLLSSQRSGESNIGGTFVDWNPFIVDRYNQKLAFL